MSSKSQSAMEYLTTYGWVIIIIAIILLALFELGIFNPGVPTVCTAVTGYFCSNPSYNTNTIQFTFSQNSGHYYYGDWIFVASQAANLSSSGIPTGFAGAGGAQNSTPVGSLAPGQTFQVTFSHLAQGDIASNTVRVGTALSGSIWLGYCTTQCSWPPTNFVKVATLISPETGISTSASASGYYLDVVGSPANGGTVSPSYGFYTSGTSVGIRAIANAVAGYSFGNWSCTGAGCSNGGYSGVSSSNTVTLNGNITETANFQSNTLTGGFSLNMIVSPSGAGSVSPGNVASLSSGQKISISALPNSGYTFNSWSGTGSGGYTGSNNPASVTMNTDIVETASFLLPAPTVTAISPNSAANIGSASITSITGTNFASDATANLVMAGQSTIVCSGFTFTNSNTLSSGTCPITGAALGTWNVIVTNPSGQNGMMEGGFTVTLPAPTVAAINPTSATNGGSASITSITGNYFVSGATANLVMAGQSTIVCTGFTFTNSNTLSSGSCPISGAAAGAWNVVVTNPSGQSGILAGGFMVTAAPVYDPTSYSGTLNVIFDSSMATSGLTGNILTTGSVTINPGATLQTNGYIIVSGSTFSNSGTINTGNATNGGAAVTNGGQSAGPGGGGSYGIYIQANQLSAGIINANGGTPPNGYLGGSSGASGSCPSGGNGGSTLAPGGIGGHASDSSSSTSVGATAGSTPSAPTMSTSNIQTWNSGGFGNYINAAGGGSGAISDDAPYTSGNNGGSVPNSYAGSGGGGGTSCSQLWLGGGGGGGGVIMLAYGSGGYVAGTYHETGGNGQDGGANGGNGQSAKYSYGATPPITP